MKQIKRRASAALLLALFMAAGTLTLLVRLYVHGDEWAAYSANTSVYSSRGVLACGTLTDRHGVVLAASDDGDYRYADDVNVRLGSLHAVGDYRGFIGGTALSAFSRKLTGYSPVYGTTRTGQDVALSLDAELQSAAWRELGGRKGAVLIMNYETGEILCMVSSPSYDPLGDPDQSVEGIFLNRCTNAVYTPGSVFKLITTCAAIENIPDLNEKTYTCYGSYDVNGVEIHCLGHHGKQTAAQALQNSCNCAFAQIALELGGDAIADYAKKLGFTESHSLDGIVTAAGNVEAVQERSSYLAWSGIGQHTDLICPYSMLRYVAAIAGEGTLREPTLLCGGSNGSTKLLKTETAQTLREMMPTYGGTFPGLEVSAKSGTAELGDGDTNAWMVGFLRSGAPLAFVVVLERGGGGLAKAGPAANAIMHRALELYEAEDTTEYD